jgi:hypothetical protein
MYQDLADADIMALAWDVCAKGCLNASYRRVPDIDTAAKTSYMSSQARQPGIFAKPRLSKYTSLFLHRVYRNHGFRA